MRAHSFGDVDKMIACRLRKSICVLKKPEVKIAPRSATNLALAFVLNQSGSSVDVFVDGVHKRQQVNVAVESKDTLDLGLFFQRAAKAFKHWNN